MEIKGKVISVLDVVTGEGKNGTWKKQDYVIDNTESKFPKKVCFTVWGDKIDVFNIQVDADIIASIEIESREYNSKWYTNVTAWKVVPNDVEPATAENTTNEPFEDDGEGDELPF